MRAIRRRDTRLERAIRSELHRAGLRFRVDFPIRPDGGRLIRPDIVFTRHRVAVFVDGCFWHGCPEHGRRAEVKNEHYWRPKIDGNIERDQCQSAALRNAGWTVLRYWEHDPADRTARQIVASLKTLGTQTLEPVGQTDDASVGE
jgi:DNA mismatch endonuclease (patch repair protein)